MIEEPLFPEPIDEIAYPHLSTRVQSAFIDLLFIVLLMAIFGALLELFGEVPNAVRIGLFVFIWVLYEPLFIAFGCTVGNYIKGIRVRRVDNTRRRIPLHLALIRYIVKFFLGWISFITIHGNKERRAIHDLAAGSVMVWR